MSATCDFTFLRAAYCASIAAFAFPYGADAQRTDRAAAVDARCEHLRGVAASRASVLQAPALELQLIRVPGLDDSADAAYSNGEVQPRVAVRVDVVGIGRGGIVRHRAEAECGRIRAEMAVQSLAAGLDDIGRVAGLRARLAAFDDARVSIDEALARTEQRLADGLVTLDEADAIRLRTIELERLRAVTLIELQSLSDRASDEQLSAQTFRESGSEWEDADARIAAYEARLRRLEAIAVVARGGVLPAPRIDWFGTVSVSVSFGAMTQGRRERAAEDARVRELDASEGAPREIVLRLDEDLDARARSLIAVRDSLDAQLVLLDRRDAALRDNPSMVADQARLLAMLERIRVRAERAQVQALVDALARVRGVRP